MIFLFFLPSPTDLVPLQWPPALPPPSQRTTRSGYLHHFRHHLQSTQPTPSSSLAFGSVLACSDLDWGRASRAASIARPWLARLVHGREPWRRARSPDDHKMRSFVSSASDLNWLRHAREESMSSATSASDLN